MHKVLKVLIEKISNCDLLINVIYEVARSRLSFYVDAEKHDVQLQKFRNVGAVTKFGTKNAQICDYINDVILYYYIM